MCMCYYSPPLVGSIDRLASWFSAIIIARHEDIEQRVRHQSGKPPKNLSKSPQLITRRGTIETCLANARFICNLKTAHS